MSVTFSIEGISEEQGYDLPCPLCGVSINQAAGNPDLRNYDCRSCDGYGGPPVDQMPRPQFELNMANFNACALLQWLGLTVECWGTADPKDVLAALAVKDQHDLITADVQFGNVVAMGRDAEQVGRYVAALQKIATKADQYGRRIVWG